MNLYDAEVNGPHKERREFSERLVQALTAAGYPNVGPTKVARMYNARSANPVSCHAVRKWLNCEALPRQYHVETLAEWLACDAAWLRFGGESGVVRQKNSPGQQNLLLLRDLDLLDPVSKHYVYELVEILKRKQ